MALKGAAQEIAVRFADILKNTETYPAARMQIYQRNLLERLIRHARVEVPFYATRLDPLFGSGDTIRWEAWTDIPPLSRTDAYEAGDALFARTTPQDTGSYRERNTSGSTGMPLRTRSSSIMSLLSTSINQRLFDWHGINPDETICFIIDVAWKFPYPDGVPGQNWNLKNPKAPAYNLSVGYTVEQQVEWLNRKQPDILCAHPANAGAIVESFVQQSLLIPFHTVLVHGEVLEPDTKALINKAGLRAIDRYGGEEVGTISASCPQSSCHHQFSEIALMETLSLDDNRIVEAGRSQLTVTPFYNYAMPLIRYKNGDLVDRSATPCACGRTLPTIDHILGRVRNMFTFSDGSQIRPNLMRTEYAPFLPAKQFQVIQHTPTRLEVRYVVDDPSRPVDPQGLTTLLQKMLHKDITVELTPLPELSRAPSGKFETWISHVKSTKATSG